VVDKSKPRSLLRALFITFAVLGGIVTLLELGERAVTLYEHVQTEPGPRQLE
jgi:hypothetical protein